MFMEVLHDVNAFLSRTSRHDVNAYLSWTTTSQRVEGNNRAKEMEGRKHNWRETHKKNSTSEKLETIREQILGEEEENGNKGGNCDDDEDAVSAPEIELKGVLRPAAEWNGYHDIDRNGYYIEKPAEWNGYYDIDRNGYYDTDNF